jgi:UDP-glucose 4-epimerase
MVLPTHRQDIEFYHGSLLDLPAIRMALNDIDVVFHLAAVADVKAVVDDPHYSESINVGGTMNVLEAVRLSNRVNRVIYGSTTWVYSDAREQDVDEQTPLMAPSHLYTATKVASEYYCQSYSKLYGVDTTILRYGIPYGPRARDGAVVPIFVGKALRGEPLTIAGDGSQFRKFVYVADLAEGNVLAMKPIAVNKIYNLDGTEKVTIRQIAETVQMIVEDVEIEHVPARQGDFSGKEVSSELARSELGWVPKVSFEDGVRQYVEWYKERAARKAADWNKVSETLKPDTPTAP